ncbi:MAG: preprotein translocase subunit SecG [Cytophagales bacterium]
MLIITIISTVVVALMTGAILLQNPKSGGAGPMMGGSQLMGHQRTTDILEKATWGGVSVLILVCITYGIFQSNNSSTNSVNMEKAKTEKLPSGPVKP